MFCIPHFNIESLELAGFSAQCINNQTKSDLVHCITDVVDDVHVKTDVFEALIPLAIGSTDQIT